MSHLRTRCTILESQVDILQNQNADLKATLTLLHPDEIISTDKKIKSGWKDVEKIGKFTIKDDGSFQV